MRSFQSSGNWMGLGSIMAMATATRPEFPADLDPNSLAFLVLNSVWMLSCAIAVSVWIWQVGARSQAVDVERMKGRVAEAARRESETETVPKVPTP